MRIEIILLIMASAGMWMIQDGLGSIFWYRNSNETLHNNIWRIARTAWGIVLVIIAFINI